MYYPQLEVAARRLLDLCEKYFASSHHGKSSVITEMWSPTEDFCNAPQCTVLCEVVRRSIHELVQVFNASEEDEVLIMEEWSVLVRDTVRKHGMDAESQ